MLEAYTKKRIKLVLDKYANSIYYYMPVPAGYGAATLDYLGYCCGQGFAIEAKRPGGRPSQRQMQTIERIMLSGARVFVIDPGNFALTPSGARWFESRGISAESLPNPRRVLCRPCLDWGERRHHLAGALGAALMQHCFDSRWARRVANSRVVAFTPLGERELRRMISA